LKNRLSLSDGNKLVRLEPLILQEFSILKVEGGAALAAASSAALTLCFRLVSFHD
jgi:hypothetical protein